MGKEKLISLHWLADLVHNRYKKESVTSEGGNKEKERKGAISLINSLSLQLSLCSPLHHHHNKVIFVRLLSDQVGGHRAMLERKRESKGEKESVNTSQSSQLSTRYNKSTRSIRGGCGLRG